MCTLNISTNFSIVSLETLTYIIKTPHIPFSTLPFFYGSAKVNSFHVSRIITTWCSVHHAICDISKTLFINLVTRSNTRRRRLWSTHNVKMTSLVGHRQLYTLFIDTNQRLQIHCSRHWVQTMCTYKPLQPTFEWKELNMQNC